MKTLPMVNIIV